MVKGGGWFVKAEKAPVHLIWVVLFVWIFIMCIIFTIVYDFFKPTTTIDKVIAILIGTAILTTISVIALKCGSSKD